MTMIRFFYDMASQGHSLHFCPDTDDWSTVVTAHRVLIRDARLEGKIKDELDRLILYSDRKTVGLEDLFGEVEEQYNLLPWDMVGKIPLSKKDVVIENLNKHSWLIPNWMESTQPEGFDAFFNISHEVSRLSNIRRLTCKDGPCHGDVCNVRADARRYQTGHFIYEVVGDELVYLKSLK